ncbi:MAG: class I SAM-dependent methyltransferase [Anaerolineales bacterium]|jgi:SAM-dependent methyltransferase
MHQTGYEPTRLEIALTLGLGWTILSPYYRAFVESLNFYGHERVIDFGSGAGVCSRHIAARLRQAGGHLDCVDISGGWNRVIRRMMWRFKNVEYHHGDIETLDLPDDTYDAVVVHFVLHDIPKSERGRIVAALVDKLKPAGRLLLREPVGQGLSKNEIKTLAETSELHTASLVEHKVSIGEVIDGNFIDIQPPKRKRRVMTGSFLPVPAAV